jgi:hypothetical protein
MLWNIYIRYGLHTRYSLWIIYIHLAMNQAGVVVAIALDKFAQCVLIQVPHRRLAD